MDECACPGDLILDHYNQQRGGKTVYAREGRTEVSTFFKCDIEEKMADTKNPRGRIRSSETTIENEPPRICPEARSSALSTRRAS